MSLVETEGLVLKSYSLAEADKIVVLLTRDQGLVRGVAKGAKRLKSRYGGSLEPFSIVDITYFQKEERELVSIRQIELVKSFFDHAAEPLFLQKFAYLTELLVNFAPPHDPDEKLYRMAKICLETAANNPTALESIALYFELWVLRLGGFLPNWNVCKECGREFDSNEETTIQINFHLVCRNCRKSKASPTVTASERKIYRLALRLTPEKFAAAVAASDHKSDVQAVSNFLKRIISNILGKETIGEKILPANFQ